MAYTQGSPVFLLSTASATGSWIPITQGLYHWSAWGTWGGATAQLQWSPNGGSTAMDINGATLTSNDGVTGIHLGQGHVRVALTGAGGSTALNSDLRGID